MEGQLERAGDRWRLRFVGEPPPWDAGRRWAEVHPGYVERLPPGAATIGPPSHP